MRDNWMSKRKSDVEFRIIIPARYDSTRLPGKPLRQIAGKPLLQHVFECAKRSAARHIVIATDDERIQQAAQGFGAEVCMTASTHASGTERLAEVIEKLGIADDEIVLNLQGDEPLMPAVCLDQVATLLAAKPDAVMASLCEPIERVEDMFNPNVVKVVLGRDGEAIYFSRAAVPWHRDSFSTRPQTLPAGELFFRHIGLYAYRAEFVSAYLKLAVSPIEKAESLEQLRVLWHGHQIAMAVACEKPGPGVDTQEELARVEALLMARSSLD